MPHSMTNEEREAIAAMQAAAQSLLRAEELADRVNYGQVIRESLADARKSVSYALDTAHGRN